MIGITESYRILNHLINIRWYSEMYVPWKILTAIVKKDTVIKII